MTTVTVSENAYLCAIMNHAEGPKGYLEDVFQDDASSDSALDPEAFAGVIASLVAKDLVACSCDLGGISYIRLTPAGVLVAQDN